MTPVLIDLSNYHNHLVQSSASRSGSPDGNFYFDTTNGRFELITAEELATVDLSGGAASGVQSITVAATAGTYTRASGSFLTDGFKAGIQVAFSGFALGTNSATKTIESISTDGTVITITDNTGLVDEAGGGDEVATGVAEANPLTQQLGIKFEAMYAFENQERRVDENLRKFDRYFAGNFKYAGAYEVINGNKFDDVDGSNTGLAVNSAGDSDDRVKVRGSGWVERSSTGIGRIFFGTRSLGTNIQALSQPFYQLLYGQDGVPTDFAKDGDVDEGVQIYADNNIDANAYGGTVATAAAQTITVVASTRTFTRSAGDYLTDGFLPGDRFEATGLANNTGVYTIASVTATVITITDDPDNQCADDTGGGDEQLTVSGFDYRTEFVMKLRTFGYNYSEKDLADSGIAEMYGFIGSFAIDETTHLTSGSYTIADVYDTQVSPWTGMTLEELDTPQTETGFTTADGDFTWVLNNTVPGNLDQCVAYLDAIAQTDDDINAHASNVTRGKRAGLWYEYSAGGKIIPRVGTGATGEGLFIESLVGTDKNRVIFYDDAGAQKVYPEYSNVVVTVGADAVADVLSWFHAFFLDGPASNDYNTANALTVEDASDVEVKGTVSSSGFRVGNTIVFEFDWYGDTIGGPIETNKDCVFLCEGDGGVTQAKTIFTLTSAASISASCIPTVENNT